MITPTKTVVVMHRVALWAAVPMVAIALCILPGMADARDRGVNQPGAAGNTGADPGLNQPGAAGNVKQDPGKNQPGAAGNAKATPGVGAGAPGQAPNSALVPQRLGRV